MKEKMANKLLYVGAGVGLVLFALFGLMPGSFIGGVMGLSLAGSLFGTPVQPGVIARMIIAISMLLGVLVSGLIFVTATSTIGWLIGVGVDSLATRKEKEAEQKVQ